ncbi:hypothetical protein SDC9_194068 [bioreactor metagenome]|uniref:Uncharacterized protein n=1 Tax=bioreactor metagenome TaxID=1076179 RepID=A0A645I6Q7_9ZZZZ
MRQKTLRLGYNRHAIGFLSIKCANSILQDSIRFSILVGKSHINCNSTLILKHISQIYLTNLSQVLKFILNIGGYHDIRIKRYQ